MVISNSYHVMQNLSIPQYMWNQSQAHMFAFRVKLFSDFISNAFVYEIVRYHKIFQITTHQPRDIRLSFSTRLSGIRERGRERGRRETRQEIFFEKYAFYTFSQLKALNVFRSFDIQSL